VKNFVTKVKQRTRFFQGVAIGLMLATFISYATTSLNKTFAPGTPISSSLMNANFNSIEGMLNSLEALVSAVNVKAESALELAQFTELVLPGPVPVNCGSGIYNYPSLMDISTPPSPNYYGGQYHVSKRGIYVSSSEWGFSSGTSMGYVTFEVSKDGGATWIGMGNNLVNAKLEVGYIVRLNASCYSGTGTLDTANIILKRI
jgi:hypothetical protein